MKNTAGNGVGKKVKAKKTKKNKSSKRACRKKSRKQVGIPKGHIISRKRAISDTHDESPSNLSKDDSSDEDGYDTSLQYKGYLIGMLPVEAHPDPTKENRGRHSYTLRSKSGDATIEVLLKHAAYFVKKISSKGTGPKGQVSMRTSGAHGAWEIAKSRAGFEAK